MPTMTRKNDFIIWLFLTPDQQRIYGDFLSLDTVKEVRGHGDWWCYTWDGYNVENEKPKFNLILILGLWSAVLSACIPYFQKFFFSLQYMYFVFTGLHLSICKLCFVSVKYHFKFNLIRVVLNKNNLSQVSKLFKYLLFVFYMYYYLVHLCTVYDTGLCTMLRLNSLPLLSY